MISTWKIFLIISTNNYCRYNINKFISHIGPCIEVVGYRQKKKGIKSLGDLCSDFGANVKFVLGPMKKFKNQKVKNLTTLIINKKINQIVIMIVLFPQAAVKTVLTKL